MQTHINFAPALNLFVYDVFPLHTNTHKIYECIRYIHFQINFINFQRGLICDIARVALLSKRTDAHTFDVKFETLK